MLRLAVPAFFALVAEPLFILADAAIVGHLGTPQLAGLGIAGTVLSTLVNLCVFLAYATTASVARLVGAGDRRGAIRQGVDGLWLGTLIGAALLVVGVIAAPWIVDAFGASATAAPHATTYLRISSLGIPAMLIVLAATGVLRGLQDTRTPLVVAVAGFAANLVLNLVLVYGFDFGIAGSAWGTVIAQWAMAAAYLAVVVRGARAHEARLVPDFSGIRASAAAGAPLFVRTVSLRAILIIGAVAATRMGDTEIATHQVAWQIWTFLAFALDALAIAAQAIVGRALGAGDAAGARSATRRMLAWSVWTGVVFGLVIVAARPLYVPWFTGDPDVRHLLGAVLLAAAALQPLAGPVFVLDGVLIGAGDGRFLALMMPAVLLVFAGAVAAVTALGGGLVALWWCGVGSFMAARLLLLGWRAKGDAWLVTGARVK
ncbi:MATE family efflux transporter [Yinghuangia sp. KLBMP8922]|uniref:MATE family efflux transporter n=1 Tax=Yinghuangia soli TaxID=2908204 RepID=A0AA41Q6H8_9ACTN|nr:MATE family efflux transporter [Yinghuangia soli]MCF2532166.1 MATE family efflux transporter [Yinghuangia soli]